MTVKIVPESNSQECPASDYVRVSTCHDPLDETVTLATIERVVEKQRGDRSAESRHIKTLILRRPMSTDAALGLATCYAERKNIPVVYTA